MNYDKISALIMNESDNIIYITDPETYKILYMNQPLLDSLKISKEDYINTPCYELLQGHSSPCPFCSDLALNKDCYFYWKNYNPIAKRHFAFKGKLIRLNEKEVRLISGTDITDSELMCESLHQQIDLDETLVKCIQTLSENTNIDTAINRLLELIGNFYQADRAYIFEINYEDNVFSNSYEWCREGILPQLDNLQLLPLYIIDHWLTTFEDQGEFSISSLDQTLKPDTLEYQILHSQGIDHLIAAPLVESDVITGFIGVDNPMLNINCIQLIKSITFFIQNDITKRRMIDDLRRISYFDSLTGLKNRNSYMEMISALEKNPPSSLGIVFIDVNGLKTANDNYGHQYGDNMLKSVADGLMKFFPEYSFRIGGDEFVSFCPNMSEEEFDTKILNLRTYEKNECICAFSVGANYRSGNINVSDQIGHSDNLMYVEKQLYYDNIMNGTTVRHAALSQKLIAEIKKGSFIVYLQPKVALKTGALFGAEALVRRIGNDNSLIPPDRFIPLYEDEGIIRYIDLFVLEEVCKTLKQWEEQDHIQIPVAVNFSRITLMEHNIAEKMTSILNKYGIASKQIIVEVTESAGKMDPETLEKLIQNLIQNGYSIALDDFGSKYSNLSILTNVNFTELKFDKSLIDTIEKNEKARIIVEHSIDMCRSLKQTSSTAEGIENAMQADLLSHYQCDVGQGYYFSKPIPIDEFYKKYISPKNH